MGKRSVVMGNAGTSSMGWDPERKETWHLEFEKEPVNDEKWSCLVTAAIPAEATDEECLQIYRECVATGLRKSVKVISMADVVRLLKGRTSASDGQKMKGNKTKAGKAEKVEVPEKRESIRGNPRPSQIVGLAASHATFFDNECKLPPELLAAVLKHLILTLKDENCVQKRVDAVRGRKMRERLVKAKFIRSLRAFEESQEERGSFEKVPPNFLGLREPINDQPFNGPDLYILLTEIHDVACFSELVRMGVPLMGLIKVSVPQEKELATNTFSPVLFPTAADANSKKSFAIADFWDRLTRLCNDPEETHLKQVAMLRYHVPLAELFGNVDGYANVFHEITKMQYFLHKIHRHHQSYLRQLFVQRLPFALEPLDLSRCRVYNALCDHLVKGGSLTHALVLHAIIEQVVAGVPETETVCLDYEPNHPGGGSPAPVASRAGSKPPKESPLRLTTPCAQCRGKVPENICQKLHKFPDDQAQANTKWTEPSEESSPTQSENEEGFHEASCHSAGVGGNPSKESPAGDNLSDVLEERKAEKEARKEKRWQAPELCLYGDRAFLETFHADPRILTSDALIERFLKTTAEKQVWRGYPELSPEDKSFFRFHFSNLRKLSSEREEALELKMYFTVSMKLISMMKSYLFRGEEISVSVSAFSPEGERLKTSKVKFEQPLRNAKFEARDCSSNFLRTFGDAGFLNSKKNTNESGKNLLGSSIIRVSEIDSLSKILGNINMTVVSHRSSGVCFPLYFRSNEKTFVGSSSHSDGQTKDLQNLWFILELSDISSMGYSQFINNKDEYQQIVQSFAFYESLEPHVMAQRLLEAKESFNTTQYLYFSPTDTIVALMMNDCDFRGVFYTKGTGVLETPVCFRDFYTFVHPGISEWILEEEERHSRQVAERLEEAREEEARKDEEYLEGLKREYCGLSQVEREEYLETRVDVRSEPEVVEEELEELPARESFLPPRRVSFVATNLTDVRVQVETKVQEFYSRDGTEVNVFVDGWLYEASKLLKLSIRKRKLCVYYHQWLDEEEVNTSFTLKTDSDIILSFFKGRGEGEEDLNYRVNVSWPTGLLVTPVFLGSGVYVRQRYGEVYRGGWEIGEERSRCFLKTGEVVVRKENGDVDILRGSGTKCSFRESGAVPGYEIMTTTGEIWEVRTKGHCGFRGKQRARQKVFLGSDVKTQEIYYRREDGVSCMLWPNGRLVTTYPDGTKITSAPFFDGEVTTEWSEEEKAHFLAVESKHKLEGVVSGFRSRTILRNSSTPRMAESAIFRVEAFSLVSCSYLLEHPKYSTVCFNPQEPYVTLTMPQELKVLVYPEGNYEVQQGSQVLTVRSSTVKFCTTCENCDRRSTATIDFEDAMHICEVVDFFEKGFFVSRKGLATHHDNVGSQGEIFPRNSETTVSKLGLEKCPSRHMPSDGDAQRCFAFHRDMSGFEFIHADSLAHDCYHLPEDTYFDLNSGEPPYLSHTFSSPYSRIGHENWVMDYQENDNSLPTNLKKKDLKELGSKDSSVKLFKYPFPKGSDPRPPSAPPPNPIDMPKVTVVRTVNCLSPQPQSIIQSIYKHIVAYQTNAHATYNAFSSFKPPDHNKENRVIKTRLRKIALTLGQNLKMYPHLCTQSPSTEKDIHYSGHFVHLMEEFRSHTKDDRNLLPNCKHIPRPLPRLSDFPSIQEENESP